MKNFRIKSSQIPLTLNEKNFEEKYSGEGEESSGGNQEHIPRRKRSNEQRFSVSNDITNKYI